MDLPGGWVDFTTYEISIQLAQEAADDKNQIAARIYDMACADWQRNRQQMGPDYEKDHPIPDPPKKWIQGLVAIAATFGKVIFPGAVQTDQDLVPKYVLPTKPDLPDGPGFLRPLDKSDPNGPWAVVLCKDILSFNGKRATNPVNFYEYSLVATMTGNFRRLWWERVPPGA